MEIYSIEFHYVQALKEMMQIQIDIQGKISVYLYPTNT